LAEELFPKKIVSFDVIFASHGTRSKHATQRRNAM
jgi:hypothetical protein